MRLITPSQLKNLLLICVFLSLPLVGHSQVNASAILDSLRKNVELSKKSGEGLAHAYLTLGNQNIMIEKYTDAIPILEMAMESGQATGDTITWIRSFGSLGYAYNMRGESQKAFQYFLDGKNAADSLGIEGLQARYNFYVGDYFRLQEQFESAIKYLKEAGALYKKIGKTGVHCRTSLMSLASLYRLMSTPEGNQKALAAYQEMLSADCEGGLNESEHARVYNYMGDLYTTAKQYDLAEEYILKALAFFRKEGRPSTLGHALVNLASLKRAQGDLRSAKKYTEESYDVAIKGEDIYAIYNGAHIAGEINMEFGNYKKAAEYLSIANDLRDSIETLKRVEVIANLEMKYNTAQKEEALANQELQLKNQDLALQLQQNRFQSLLGWGSFLLALLGGFFFWYRNKLKQKEKEAENLEQINQLKTRYFTNISHELRTPLSLVIDPLNQLKEKVADDPAQKQLVSTASASAKRMLQLVNQMLDLNKLEAGKLPLKAQARDLKFSLAAIIESFHNFSEERKISVSFKSEPDELTAYIDPDQFEKIIVNLLANAFKFTEAGGSVTIALSQSDKHAVVKIKDTGKGIPADKLPYIFDRFYQVDDSETRASQGTGIGLSLVKELVELHHGSITASSVLGKETQITIRLPLGKDHLQATEIVATKPTGAALSESANGIRQNGEDGAVAAPHAAASTDKEAEEKPLLLIIEDHQELRTYIQQQLRPDYQILEAANGIEGLAMATEHIPDLIISDVMMPGMDGYDLCQQVKENEGTAHIPVILLTAKSTPEDKLHGLKKMADDYITKPFNSEELRTRVTNLIEQRKQLRSKFAGTKNLSPKDIAVNSINQAFLDKLMNIIEENISNANFGVEEMSQAIAMSRSQLHRKLKALTGQSSSAFLRNFRLKRAYQLLEQSAGNASEIAFQVGFSNPNYFFKCFKEVYGLTPGQVLKGEKV